MCDGKNQKKWEDSKKVLRDQWIMIEQLYYLPVCSLILQILVELLACARYYAWC